MAKGEVRPDPKNSNKGTARGAAIVRASLKEHGAARSIVTDKNRRIIAGNTTFREWRRLGKPYRVVETDGGELVVVVRKDLDLKNAKTRKLQVVDNQATVVGVDWDVELLRSLEKSGAKLADGVTFTTEEWEELFAGRKTSRGNDPEPTRTKITAEHRCPKCGHRIACGSRKVAGRAEGRRR